MPVSIWDYLRARTRDAVLAGFNDAIDIVEQGDSNGSQHLAATNLVARLNAQGERTLPEPSVGSGPSANGNGAHAVSELLGAPTKTPTGPKRAVGFDDELEQRLEAAATQSDQETPAEGSVPPGRLTNLKRRGRPPKNRQDGK